MRMLTTNAKYSNFPSEQYDAKYVYSQNRTNEHGRERRAADPTKTTCELYMQVM